MDRLRRWLIYHWLLLIALLKDLIIHRHVCVDFVQEVWVKLELELLFLFVVLVLIWVVIGATNGNV